MFSQWLPRCRFHFRRLLRMQPAGLSALLVSVVALVSALVAYGQQWHGALVAEQEWRSLNIRFREAERRGHGGGEKLELQVFNNTQLVATLNSVAEEFKLSLDEVSFVLDDNAGQPYLRYRATLTVSSAYPAIRRFLDQVRARQPEVSLDSITCTRDDIATVDLTCDLALSAFYRKGGRG